MRIHIFCDQKWRDLPNLVALKVCLEDLGHRVLLSTTKDAALMVKAFRPDCVVINHLFAPANQEFAKRLRQSGVAVVVMPTEGAVRPELKSIGDGVFAKEWEMDLFLAWSEPAAQGVRDRWKLNETIVQTIGCTRFDFYNEKFRPVITTREDFCAQNNLDPGRKIVTFATNYSFADLDSDQKFKKEAAENGIQECYAIIGVTLPDLVRFHRTAREESIKSFVALTQALPYVQFIIRPHPAEGRDYYRQRIAHDRLTNVRFCPQDYIWNILNAADVHLHRQCTTAIEGWFWNKPTVEMAMGDSPKLAWPDREAGSDIAGSTQELIAIVQRYLVESTVCPDLETYRQNYIRAWFGVQDGRRCRAAAQAIHEMLTRRGKSQSYWSASTSSLPGRPGSIAAATLRYALGMLPNAPFFAAASNEALDPYDKQITRRDVRSYMKRVASLAA